MYFLFQVITFCESGFASDLFLSQMSKQFWKFFFFFWLISWPEYLPQKRNAEFGSIKKKKSNRPIFKSFSEMSKLSQPVTEDKRSPKTNWCALKPVPLTHLLIYTDLQLIVLDLITRPKQWYLKRSHQLARLQVIGLFLYSIAKFMKITKLYIFKDVKNIMHMWQMDLWTGKLPHRTSLRVVFHLHQQRMWGMEGFYCSLCN